MARRLQRIPDYFTEEEAAALVDAAPSYPTRMAFRIMLRTGLRVSEALALRRVDLRLDQDPPIIVVRADSPGNKARKGRTLCGMKQRESGQAYLNGLALNYNYFRPHQALAGKKPAESAGAVIPFESWRDVASMTEAS